MLAFHLKGIAVAVALGALTRLLFGGAFETFLVVLLAILITVAIGLMKRLATTYTITDRRLNIRRGIVSREIQETRLERVQNVNYRQGLMQRVLRVGDVDFDTASTGEDYSFVFAGVADPAGVIHRVDGATPAGKAAAGPKSDRRFSDSD